MAAPPFFEATEPDANGIIYYIIPAGTHLFRGDIPPNYEIPLEHISGPVFFGQTADVTLLYGIPFEFKTKSELRLLALDKSMKTINDNALKDKTLIDGKPVKEVIPSILKRIYGYNGGVRNSADAGDKKLTKYICERYNGYATDFMETGFGGEFHREIVICNKDNVEFVKKLTDVNGIPVNEKKIIHDQNLRKAAPPIKKRKAEEEGFDEEDISSVVGQKLSFGDFGDSDEEGGGKSRKRTKSHKKQMRNKRRKTHKKGKPKKATHKRK